MKKQLTLETDLEGYMIAHSDLIPEYARKGMPAEKIFATGIPCLSGNLENLIICATFVTYFLILVAQKRIRPTIISMYSYVQPIIAISISIAIGMDVLTRQKVLAAVMVFGGVIIVSFSKSASR